MFCRFCGSELYEDSIYCSKCGKKVEVDNSHNINTCENNATIVANEIKNNDAIVGDKSNDNDMIYYKRTACAAIVIAVITLLLYLTKLLTIEIALSGCIIMASSAIIFLVLKTMKLKKWITTLIITAGSIISLFVLPEGLLYALAIFIILLVIYTIIKSIKLGSWKKIVGISIIPIAIILAIVIVQVLTENNIDGQPDKTEESSFSVEEKVALCACQNFVPRLKDPDSFEAYDVRVTLANPDEQKDWSPEDKTYYVCIGYRAKNSFGGKDMDEQIIIVKDYTVENGYWLLADLEKTYDVIKLDFIKRAAEDYTSVDADKINENINTDLDSINVG